VTEQTVLRRRRPPPIESPLPPREALPTMYDLPSEDPEEPGLPDEFHDLQPQLLRETFQPPGCPPERLFVGTDLNLYYDVRHPLWHKRPDWFAVLGVPRLYNNRDLRLSYVLWQEGVAPVVVVELLSPGTEPEDLGRTALDGRQPPSKWTVYEQILRIPHYVVFNRYTDTVRYFELTDGGYQEAQSPGQRLWLPEAGLGLGLWRGRYQGLERCWLRFLDAEGAWVPTPLEREQRRAEQERQRAERLAAQLKALGVEPE